LAVKVNGNRGAQQEIYVSTKVSKKALPFQQEFPIKECDVKNDPIEHLESEPDKKIRLRLHPKTSNSLRLRLRNPAQNACASGPVRIVSYSYTVIVTCTAGVTDMVPEGNRSPARTTWVAGHRLVLTIA